MKKMSILVIALLLVLTTGCGKADTLTCNRHQSYGESTLDTKVEYTFKDGYAVKVKTTMEAGFDSETTAKNFANQYKDMKDYEVSQKGKIVTLKNTTEVSDEDKKLEDNKKDKVKEIMEGSEYKCK